MTRVVCVQCKNTSHEVYENLNAVHGNLNILRSTVIQIIALTQLLCDFLTMNIEIALKLK